MSLSYRNKRIKRIFSKGTHRSYWEKHADCEQYLKTWYNTAMNADWKSPSDVKETYASASILKQRRIVFNIKGNTYRLITKINFEKQWMFIQFIGTHAEYDKIDVEKIMTMNIKPIKSENDYQEALQRLDELFDAKIGTSESDEADTLALLIDNYESKHSASHVC